MIGTWNQQLCAHIWEINRQLLEWLRAAAAQRIEQRYAALGRLLREDWAAMDERALDRMARTPCLLLDAGFERPDLWAAVRRATCPGPAWGAAVRDVSAGCFRSAEGVALVRRALTLSWHVAQINPTMARILCGVSEAGLSQLAVCRLLDLERVAEATPPWIAPRWLQRPLVWRQMMASACRGGEAEMRLAQIRSIALLAGGERPTTRP